MGSYKHLGMYSDDDPIYKEGWTVVIPLRLSEGKKKKRSRNEVALDEADKIPPKSEKDNG